MVSLISCMSVQLLFTQNNLDNVQGQTNLKCVPIV